MGKRVVVISGLAGAGKSTAARALEDIGYFVVDNLPPQLIETLLDLADGSGGKLSRIALVIDAREFDFLKEFGVAWDRLRHSGHHLQLVFLDCDDDILVRRYKETRRRHPLGDGDGVRAGIAKERSLLAEMQHRADDTIDTTELSVHELKQQIVQRFDPMREQAGLLTTLLSFGFKHGLPGELDLCFDARFLPNPYFVPELRPHTGLDDAVRDYVLSQPDAAPFLEKLEDLLIYLHPRYLSEGKAYLTVAIGCTGGKHRSVALVTALAQRLRARGLDVRSQHRDVDKSERTDAS